MSDYTISLPEAVGELKMTIYGSFSMKSIYFGDLRLKCNDERCHTQGYMYSARLT